jgi:predicted N-acetyltransferase YhbS
MATLPTHRGLGAASQLLRWGLDRADQEGLEAYVEASAAVVPMYERFGFRTVGTYEVRRIVYVESFMVRAPRGVKGGGGMMEKVGR